MQAFTPRLSATPSAGGGLAAVVAAPSSALSSSNTVVDLATVNPDPSSCVAVAPSSTVKRPSLVAQQAAAAATAAASVILAAASLFNTTDVVLQVRLALNLERTNRRLPMLKPASSLDSFARMQAQFMASQASAEKAFDNERELCVVLKGRRAAAECVASGATSAELLHELMDDGETKRLILSQRFSEFGLGVARSRKDGKLYLCYLLRQVL